MILPKDGATDIGIGRHDVIQNYCIASPDVTNIVFFPFGLGAMANHAESDKANMKLEWYWWNEEEKERKMSTSAADLKAAQFAQLDIAYIALRDISEGEELMYDYGDAWAQSWMEHLASINQWFINAAIRETYEINHEIIPGQANLGSSVKPRFLSFVGSEDLFLPIWKAESSTLIDEAVRIASLPMANAGTEKISMNLVSRSDPETFNVSEELSRVTIEIDLPDVAANVTDGGIYSKNTIAKSIDYMNSRVETNLQNSFEMHTITSK